MICCLFHCLTKKEKALQDAISVFYFLTVACTGIVFSNFTQIFLVFSSNIEYISSQVSMKLKKMGVLLVFINDLAVPVSHVLTIC